MTGPADGQKPYSLMNYLGGQAGRPNEIYIVRNGERIPVAGKRNVPLQEGDQLLHISGGGAGVGDPREREAELVREDVLEGVISVEGAQRDYGVVIDSESLEVDVAATAGLRREMKSE